MRYAGQSFDSLDCYGGLCELIITVFLTSRFLHLNFQRLQEEKRQLLKIEIKSYLDQP